MQARRWAACLLALVGALASSFAASDGQADSSGKAARASLEIRGSGAALPLAQKVAEAYMADHPDAAVVVASGGNRRGLKSLIVGTCDMAVSSIDLPADLKKLAADTKVEIVSADVYRDAVVVVTHPHNPIKDLSLGQLRDVFRGAVTNWSEIGGRDAPIVVTTTAPTAATFEIFKKAVLGDDAVITPRAHVTSGRDLEKDIGEDAIGYTTLRGARALQVLTVGGFVANADTIASGRYPIRRTVRVFQRKPETAIGKAVLEYFLAPDKGQAFVRALGDVAVRP
jgi:phosphate transport system substrate-binding protein